jgi:hypothetical protein
LEQKVGLKDKKEVRKQRNWKCNFISSADGKINITAIISSSLRS